MEVLSVNISDKKKVQWQSRTIETGIFKKEVSSIFIDTNGVNEDKVVDLKHHGGEDMAVYGYCKKHYAYFKKLHPKVVFNHGIFGENITISNLLETEVFIGDTFQVGEAIIQVAQPRFPCFKLGIVFNSQKIVKQYLHTTYTGFYFRVLQKGCVKKGDKLSLIKQATNSMTVAEIYSIYTTNKGNTEFIQRALNLKFLADRCKESIRKRL